MNKQFTSTLLQHSKHLSETLNALHINDYTDDFFLYNVFDYAWNAWETYISMYAKNTAHTLLLGINPGPHGMVQTGIPFGHIPTVEQWLHITPILKEHYPTHPKRPIRGIAYKREEPSGKLLWHTIKNIFPTPEHFFSQCFMLNYSPLAFFTNDDKASNITPDKLPIEYRKQMEQYCSLHLMRYIQAFGITHILGIGKYAYNTATKLLKAETSASKNKTIFEHIQVHYITHPSPLNPKHKTFPDEFSRCLKTIGIIP